MTEAEYKELTQAVLDVKFLIVKNGGMATKSAVEDYFIQARGLDRLTIHEILNHLEYNNVLPFVISDGKVYWNQIYMMRPEPKLEQYPGLTIEPFGRKSST